MNLDELNQEIKKIMDERNNAGVLEFEGYSPSEMYNILHFLFEQNCPIRIKQLKSDEFMRIPIFNGVKFLLNQVSVNNGIKLTAKGFLPTKIVSALYAQQYFAEEMIEKGIVKLHKEIDSHFVRLSRILLELTGVVKKAKGSLSITSKGKKALDDDQSLLEKILVTYCTKFNWAYFDGYEMEDAARLGCGYSIYLLDKYGNDVHQDNFYSQKYFTAFPMLTENVQSSYGTVENYLNRCYSHRMLEQFGLITGIINKISGSKYGEPKQFQKTDLLNILFECKQPRLEKK
jgi:hypothetical protein